MAIDEASLHEESRDNDDEAAPNNTRKRRLCEVNGKVPFPQSKFTTLDWDFILEHFPF
jgi:hypothetical protein